MDDTTRRLSADRVRARSARSVLRRIDEVTLGRLTRCESAPASKVDQRLDELDREWDTDRLLEVEAAATGLVGLALGVVWRPALLALPALVGASMLTYAISGRYPMMPLFRRMGVRTSKEIARERYALKALRGDFDGLDAPAPPRTLTAVEASA
jgi:hypothetical protein